MYKWRAVSVRNYAVVWTRRNKASLTTDAAARRETGKQIDELA